MVDAEYFKERQIWIDRDWALERKVTEPLAALLLHDIVLDLETQAGEERQSPTAPHPDALSLILASGTFSVSYNKNANTKPGDTGHGQLAAGAGEGRFGLEDCGPRPHPASFACAFQITAVET